MLGNQQLQDVARQPSESESEASRKSICSKESMDHQMAGLSPRLDVAVQIQQDGSGQSRHVALLDPIKDPVLGHRGSVQFAAKHPQNDNVTLCYSSLHSDPLDNMPYPFDQMNLGSHSSTSGIDFIAMSAVDEFVDETTKLPPCNDDSVNMSMNQSMASPFTYPRLEISGPAAATRSRGAKTGPCASLSDQYNSSSQSVRATPVSSSSTVNVNTMQPPPPFLAPFANPASGAPAPSSTKPKAPARRRANSTTSLPSPHQQRLFNQNSLALLMEAVSSNTALVGETSTKLNENLIFMNDRLNYLHKKFDYLARKSTLQFAINQTSVNSFQYYSGTGQVHDSALLVKSILMSFLAGKGYYIPNTFTTNGVKSSTGEPVYGNWVFREKLSAALEELCGVEPVFAIGDMDGYQIFFGTEAFNAKI